MTNQEQASFETSSQFQQTVDETTDESLNLLNVIGSDGDFWNVDLPSELTPSRQMALANIGLGNYMTLSALRSSMRHHPVVGGLALGLGASQAVRDGQLLGKAIKEGNVRDGIGAGVAILGDALVISGGLFGIRRSPVPSALALFAGTGIRSLAYEGILESPEVNK